MNDYVMLIIIAGGVLVSIVFLSRFSTDMDPRWITAAATGTLMVIGFYVASWMYSIGHSLLDFIDILTGRKSPRDELVGSMQNLVTRIVEIGHEEESDRSGVT